MVPTRVLVVWCPDWPVAAAGITAGVAAAVFKSNRAVACSPAARAEGVVRGLRRREAQARCPSLVVIEHDPARDARVFEPIVAAVEKFAPRVEILRPGLCAVPTRGPSRYFGGDEALAAKVGDAVFAVSGHRCLTGIADGPFAATLAARQGRIVPSEDTASFLAPFPVSALDRPELADLLARLGIRTLGQLAAVPAEDVLARFGLDGALAHRLARGLDERPPATRTPPPDLVVEHELDPPAQRVDVVAFVGKMLADDLHERLSRLGLACTRVAVEAETAHGESLRRLWRHEGALSASAMADRVRWQLDGWLSGTALQARADKAELDVDEVDATAGLTLLRLVPDEVVPDNGRQAGFWGGGGEGDERAARAMARVQGMLGPDAVVTAVRSGGRMPLEEATYVPWGDPRQPDRLPAPTTAGFMAPVSDGPTATTAGTARITPLPTTAVPPPAKPDATAPAATTGPIPPPAALAADAQRPPPAVEAHARPTPSGPAPTATDPAPPPAAPAATTEPIPPPTALAADAQRPPPPAAAPAPAAEAHARPTPPGSAPAPAPAPPAAAPATAPTAPAPPAAEAHARPAAAPAIAPTAPDPTPPATAPPATDPAPPAPTAPATAATPGGHPRPLPRPRLLRRRKRTPASEALAPPWPGAVPTPAPATVYPDPPPADVRDEHGRTVTVAGRHSVSAAPTTVSVDGGPTREVTAWAGPWPVDERWWDPRARRRQARFQVVDSTGTAYLLSVENGAWRVEAVYD